MRSCQVLAWQHDHGYLGLLTNVAATKLLGMQSFYKAYMTTGPADFYCTCCLVLQFDTDLRWRVAAMAAIQVHWYFSPTWEQGPILEAPV